MLKKLLVLSIMLVGGLTQAEEKGNKLVTSIYFDTGVSKVNDSELVKLKEAAETINKEKMVVALIGNADKRGGRLYNLDLADKRANEVKEVLMSLGVSEAQLLVNVSQGEEKPLAPADGLKEHLQTNRRVDVVQIKPLTVTKVRTDPVIVPYEVEKLLVRHHHLKILAGFGPSGIEKDTSILGVTRKDSVTQEFGIIGGLGYDYMFNNGFTIGVQGLTSPKLQNISGLGSVGYSW